MDCKINCNIVKKCNSCQLNNLSYMEQLKFKQNKCRKFLGSFCKIDPIIGMDTPFHYRNKAQAVFKKERDKSISWGLYKSTTNTVVKTKECKLHTKHSNEIFNTLCLLFKSFKISPYDPFKGTGFIKSVVIREGFLSNEVMVILNGADPIFPAKKTFVSALLKKHPYINTVVTTVNHDRKKLFTGKTQDVLYGKGYIKDTLLSKTFIISPQSFYQINPTQTQKLYQTAINLAQLNDTQTVLDSYCGVGTIGICASNKAKRVLSVESNKDAIIDAKENAKLNSIKNIEFVCTDAKDYIKYLKEENVKIDVAFLDPPRAGCSKVFLQSIIDMDIKTVVYISCNVETQSRDIRLLKKHGYTVEKIVPVDMFPHTNHVETVARLSKTNTENQMTLYAEPFEMIKSGKKTIELRLWDEKRQNLKVGDNIIFTNADNGETLTRTILKLHRFNSFEELYQSLPLLKCGYTEQNIDTAQVTDMEKYYSAEKQAKYGVVGIELSYPDELRRDVK